MPLTLSRKEKERIIADTIIVEVAEIRRGLVRLSVSAPEGVSVHREEVWKQIQESKAVS